MIEQQEKIETARAYGNAVKNIIDLNNYVELFDDYTMLQTVVNFLIENRYGLDTAYRINENVRAAEKERKNA